jgi:hypothetical protein
LSSPLIAAGLPLGPNPVSIDPRTRADRVDPRCRLWVARSFGPGGVAP